MLEGRALGVVIKMKSKEESTTPVDQMAALTLFWIVCEKIFLSLRGLSLLERDVTPPHNMYISNESGCLWFFNQ